MRDVISEVYLKEANTFTASLIYAFRLLLCIVTPCKNMNKFLCTLWMYMSSSILMVFISLYYFPLNLLIKKSLWLIETGSWKWPRDSLHSVLGLCCINIHYFIIGRARTMAILSLCGFELKFSLISDIIFYFARLVFQQVFI